MTPFELQWTNDELPCPLANRDKRILLYFEWGSDTKIPAFIVLISTYNETIREYKWVDISSSQQFVPYPSFIDNMWWAFFD